MPKKGQTVPYKIVFKYPHQARAATHARVNLDEAHILAGDIGKRGGNATVVYRDKHTPEVTLGRYGPDVDHTITESPNGRWTCACGATGSSDVLNEHLTNAGMEPVAWSVVSGTTDAPGVEPGAAGIDIPDHILAWAEKHGVAVENPDAYVLVTVPEHVERIDGEVAFRAGALPAADVETIRAKLAEAETEVFPHPMQGW